MKSNIISIAVVNIICIAFIAFTCYARFGTNIDVIKDVDSVPVKWGATQSKRMKNGMTYYSKHYMVLVETPEKDFEPFWVDAVDIFGTNDQNKLKEIVNDKEHVKLNIFINPDDNEVLGVTRKGTSNLALYYTNNKLLRYGIYIILGVDALVVILMLTAGRAKKKKQNKAKDVFA